MTVFVDPVLFKYGGEHYCHLWGDDEAELHKFAAKLKISRENNWWGPPLSFGHPIGFYFIPSGARKAAIKAGAVITDKYQMDYECAEATWNDKEIERIDNIRAWG